jgi:hypothetical protein
MHAIVQADQWLYYGGKIWYLLITNVLLMKQICIHIFKLYNKASQHQLFKVIFMVFNKNVGQ